MLDLFQANWRRTVELTNAAVYPLTADSNPVRVFGGVRHDALPGAFHQLCAYPDNRGTMRHWLDQQPAPTSLHPGHGLYGGPFFRHFGHFVTESVHRLWAWRAASEKFEYIAVLPQVPNPRFAPESVNDLASFQKQILHYLGIPLERIYLVTEPVIAERLTVPLQASLLGARNRRPKSYTAYMAEHEKRFFHEYSCQLPTAAEKIYVSRSTYLEKGSFAGERYLEKQLEAEGFHILHPEAVPLVEQLYFYRNARCIIFAEGSALHTAELLGPLQAHVLCLMRRTETKPLWRASVGRIFAKLDFFDAITQLPSLVMTRDGDVANGSAVTLLNGPALVAHLRAVGLAKLPNFDQHSFLQAEAADIARYLLNSNLRQTSRHNAVAERFLAFRDALAARENPYIRNFPVQS